MGRYLEIQLGQVVNVIAWDGTANFAPLNQQLVSIGAKYIGDGLPGLVPMGAGIHPGQDTEANVLPAMTGIGAKLLRLEIHWNAVEQTRGVLAFPGTQLANTQSIIQNLQANSIPFFVLLDYGNTLYGAGPGNTGAGGLVLNADELNGFGNYCAYMAQTLKGQCALYEIWNEWNTGLGATAAQVAAMAMTPSAYLTCLQTAYAAIKSVDPGAQVMVGGVAEPTQVGPSNSVWLQQFLALPWAQSADAFAIHHYYKGAVPEPWYYEILAMIQQIRATSTPNFPIYLTETGWATGTPVGNITTTEQAARYSRYPFLLRALPLNGVAFYVLRDGGTDGSTQASYGIYNNDWSSKPAVATLRDALVHIHAATTARYFPNLGPYDPSTVSAVLIQTPTGQRLAIWDAGARTYTLRLTASSAGTLSVQTMGAGTVTQAIAQGSNQVILALTSTAQVLFSNVPMIFEMFQ